MKRSQHRPLGEMVAGACAVALTLSACGNAQSDSESGANLIEGLERSVELSEDFDPSANFKYAAYYPPSSLDPHTSAGGLDQTYLAPIYDRLIYNSPAGELEPMLAETFETDGDNVTLTLRPEVSYTDGEPFTAESVKTNLERYMSDGSTLASEVAHIESISVVDELTVEIVTDGAVGATVAALSARAGMMVSPKAIDSGDVETKPVGIGPYTATDVTPGQSVSMEKTEDYWDPSVQRVGSMELIGMSEAQTRQNALQSGELSASEVDATSVSSLQGDTTGLISGPTPLVYFFAVNSSDPAFEDERVREAMNLAIDREGLAEGLFQGGCLPQIQPWPASSFAYNTDIGAGLDRWPYDPEKAIDLLEEAGFADRPSGFDAVHTNNTISSQFGEVLQSQFAEVGITINPSPVPSGGIVENFGISKSMPTTVSGYTGAPDPDAVIQRIYSAESVYNPGEWSSETVESLATEAASAPDQESRSQVYGELSEALVEEQSHIMPICALQRIVAFDEKVSNIHSGGDYQDLRGVAVSAS